MTKEKFIKRLDYLSDKLDDIRNKSLTQESTRNYHSILILDKITEDDRIVYVDLAGDELIVVKDNIVYFAEQNTSLNLDQIIDAKISYKSIYKHLKVRLTINYEVNNKEYKLIIG